jgi:propanol-preferring alcohol dehydrogenase
VRKGGTVAINAIHMSPIAQMDYGLIHGERSLRSVANMTRHDAEELLGLAAQIPARTEVEAHSLVEADRALQRLKRREVRGATVLEVP